MPTNFFRVNPVIAQHNSYGWRYTFGWLALDFYIFKQLFFNFLWTSFISLFILLMLQTLRLAEFFVVHHVSGILLFKLGGFLTLLLLPLTLPIGALMSFLVTFRRLSLDHELIAMKTSGLSLFRLSLPAFSLASMIATLLMALNLSWIPWAENAFKKTEIKIANTKIVNVIQPGTFTTGFFDLLIYSEKYNNKTHLLEKVFIFDSREVENPFIYIAKFASIKPLKTDSDSEFSLLLTLYEGNTHHHNPKKNIYEKIEFKTYDLFLSIPAGTENYLKKPHMIPQAQLLKLIAHTQRNSPSDFELRGEYWRRYATAMTPFFFVILGIGFGTIQNRTQHFNGILVGILILAGYWALQIALLSCIRSKVISPFLAMQIPNSLLFMLGYLRFKQASW